MSLISSNTALNINFEPFLPISWLIALGVFALILLGLSLLRHRHGLLLRALTIACFLLILSGPALIEEKREAVKDVALILVDESPSQDMGQRKARTKAALDQLQERLGQRKHLEIRIAYTPQDQSPAAKSETRIFDVLDSALADVPPTRRAGIIILSDGQIHDVPHNISDNAQDYKDYGPVHLLLSGEQNEKDRQIIITQSPAYGIIGQEIQVKYRVEDTNNINKKRAHVTLKQPGKSSESFLVPIGQEQILNLPINHAGQNVFELTVSTRPDEITELNNHTALLVNGVRDRLRVLLVSGKPHSGGRTWRDLLKSDPAVDLVHFTILREPGKLDPARQDELALIPFPFRELFETKLYEFDLIIFDRYQLNRILPPHYFRNITRFVERGGAFLESSGPEFAGERSIYQTDLANILPAAPQGRVIKGPFSPTLTKDGTLHPVTRNLSIEGREWGRWLRQIALNPERGDILMSGAQGNPLLILDRVEDGRVAQLASDQIWLWARGYEGGGPHTELLRRIVHWLMKEPELDEKALNVKVHEDKITLQSSEYKQSTLTLTMTKPNGENEALELVPNDEGLLEYSFRAAQNGIYTFEKKDDKARNKHGEKRFAIIGEPNPPELRALKTTPDILEPFIKATKGGVFWIAQNNLPDIRFHTRKGTMAGKSWLALQKNSAYIVTGIRTRPAIPSWLSALLLLSLAIFTWWREGKNS